MKFWKLGTRSSVIAMCIFMNGVAAMEVKAEEEFSFKVYNSTRSAIKEILVSEDNRNWGNFDIGSGIKPGETVTLVWDKRTNNEDCDQLVKAIFKDGSESEAAEFNFCEEALELEF